MAGEKRVSFGWGKCEELTLGPKAFDCGQSNDRGSEVRWARRVFWSPGAGFGRGQGPGNKVSGAPSPGPRGLMVAPHLHGERRKRNSAPAALPLLSASHEGQEGESCLVRQGLMD